MATDRQLTGMAGEFLVVGQLFKRGLQASVTIGNAKSIDVLVHNPRTGKNLAVSVKTLRKPNCFPLRSDCLREDVIYVFVVLNDAEDGELFFIVPGGHLAAHKKKFFGSSLAYPARAAVNRGPLAAFQSAWHYFEA